MSKKRNKISKLILIFPLLNVLIAFTVEGYGNDGLHLGHLRAIIYAILIIITLSRFPVEMVSRLLIFFMIYLFILTFFSTNFIYSFNVYLKVFITMMMYPVGFWYLNDYTKLVKFLKYFVFAALILSMNYIFAQVFKIGRSVYLDDSFYYGYAGIGSTVILAYMLLTIPLSIDTFKSKINKFLLSGTVFLSVLFTVIAMKRIAILALIGGFFIYMIKSNQITKSLKVIFIFGITLIITSPLYTDVLLERYEARTTERNEIQNEARYKDIMLSIHDFHTKGIAHALFGTEVFNTPGYFGRERQVHVDYANLLIGTGSIGLLMYLYIYYLILKKFKFQYSKLNRTPIIRKDKNAYKLLKKFNGVFWAIYIASLIVSLSGGLHVVGTRSILFLLLGGLTGSIYNFWKIDKETS